MAKKVAQQASHLVSTTISTPLFGLEVSGSVAPRGCVDGRNEKAEVGAPRIRTLRFPTVDAEMHTSENDQSVTRQEAGTCIG